MPKDRIFKSSLTEIDMRNIHNAFMKNFLILLRLLKCFLIDFSWGKEDRNVWLKAKFHEGVGLYLVIDLEQHVVAFIHG